MSLKSLREENQTTNSINHFDEKMSSDVIRNAIKILNQTKQYTFLDGSKLFCGNLDKTITALKAKTGTVIPSYFGIPVVVKKGLLEDEILFVDKEGRHIGRYKI